MTEHEQKCFNAALEKLNKLEWRNRVVRKLENHIDAMASEKAINLLRAIEALI